MTKYVVNDIKNVFPKIYNFITTHDMKNLEEKRYDLGDGEYVNVESYNTYDFSERRYEAHKKYKDIQYIITGKENIIIKDVDLLVIDEEYDSNRDIIFYKNNIRGIDNIIEEGEMLLISPGEGHMPCVSIDGSVYVKKAVFKILV